MTLNANINRHDPEAIKGILDTIFGPYDELCADLTGTPKVREASVEGKGFQRQLIIRLEVARRNPYNGYFASRTPVIFYYDYNNELASGYLEKADEETGSDDDPDWEACTPDMGLALLAFIAAVRMGFVK